MAHRLDWCPATPQRSLVVLGLLAIGCVPNSADRPGRNSPPVHASRQTSSVSKAPTSSDSQSAPHYRLPTNYGDGVSRVRELRDLLRAGWQANEHDQVHEPLHELAPLLRELPRLLDKEDLPTVERTEAQLAIHELFRMFGQIDSKLHSGFGSSYDELAEQIDAAIEKLQPKPGPRDS